MLLFKSKHIEPILNGTKVETRRIWKRQRVKVGSIHQCRTQMLNKESCFARVRILDVKMQRLNDMTEEEAHREGYQSKHEYLLSFAEINKLEQLPNDELYAVTFEVVKNGQ